MPAPLPPRCNEAGVDRKYKRPNIMASVDPRNRLSGMSLRIQLCMYVLRLLPSTAAWPAKLQDFKVLVKILDVSGSTCMPRTQHHCVADTPGSRSRPGRSTQSRLRCSSTPTKESWADLLPYPCASLDHTQDTVRNRPRNLLPLPSFFAFSLPLFFRGSGSKLGFQGEGC